MCPERAFLTTQSKATTPHFLPPCLTLIFLISWNDIILHAIVFLLPPEWHDSSAVPTVNAWERLNPGAGNKEMCCLERTEIQYLNLQQVSLLFSSPRTTNSERNAWMPCREDCFPPHFLRGGFICLVHSRTPLRNYKSSHSWKYFLQFFMGTMYPPTRPFTLKVYLNSVWLCVCVSCIVPSSEHVVGTQKILDRA